MPRAKQRTPQLREHVLESAVGVLSREGPAGLTARGVAAAADTSPPAIYELFGDKGGLVREVFFDGFRRLREHLAEVEPSEDPRADVIALMSCYRGFVRENPALADVMFSRPFTDFDPGPSERRAGGSVRELILAYVRRAIAAGAIEGQETDVAHVLIALVQGLAGAESARRLGGTRASVERRWELALEAMLDGLSG